MKLSSLGPNRNLIQTENSKIFFSYGNPVACWLREDGYYRTDHFWSKTTNLHINRWLSSEGTAPEEVIEESQAFFNNLWR